MYQIGSQQGREGTGKRTPGRKKWDKHSGNETASGTQIGGKPLNRLGPTIQIRWSNQPASMKDKEKRTDSPESARKKEKAAQNPLYRQTLLNPWDGTKAGGLKFVPTSSSMQRIANASCKA